jgi:hypothetical protein
VNEGYPDCQADGSVPHSLTPKRSTTLSLSLRGMGLGR